MYNSILNSMLCQSDPSDSVFSVSFIVCTRVEGKVFPHIHSVHTFPLFHCPPGKISLNTLWMTFGEADSFKFVMNRRSESTYDFSLNITVDQIGVLLGHH